MYASDLKVSADVGSVFPAGVAVSAGYDLVDDDAFANFAGGYV